MKEIVKESADHKVFEQLSIVSGFYRDTSFSTMKLTAAAIKKKTKMKLQ